MIEAWVFYSVLAIASALAIALVSIGTVWFVAWRRGRARAAVAAAAVSASPVPPPAVANAVRMAPERRDRTAMTEHQLLVDMDGDLVKLQADLGKKRTRALRARRSGHPNSPLEAEVADLEQKGEELDTQVAAHEAYLRATYPEYWKRV